ncbi:MAG: hypothetical protein ACTH31_07460, partial [Pseudoclavibacter sp.]
MTNAETSGHDGDDVAAGDGLNAWPGDAATVERWMRAEIAAEAEGLSGLDAIAIDLALEGDDLARMHVDATGVELRWASTSDDAPASGSTQAPSTDGAAGGGGDALGAGAVDEAGMESHPEVVASRRGVAHDTRFVADPIRVVGHPIWFALRAERVPISWVRYAAPVRTREPEADRAIVIGDGGAGVRAEMTASVRPNGIEGIARTITEQGLADAKSPLRLARLKIEIRGRDQRDLTATADVALGWGPLRAGGNATMRFGVEPDGMLRLHEARIGSRNPLV